VKKGISIASKFLGHIFIFGTGIAWAWVRWIEVEEYI
jgi:hypothetical protein